LVRRLKGSEQIVKRKLIVLAHPSRPATCILQAATGAAVMPGVYPSASAVASIRPKPAVKNMGTL
jgi:hypothetical protein